MNFVFLMDPLETVVLEKDTSFILMLGARRLGHKVFYLPQDGITLHNGTLEFNVFPVQPQRVARRPFIIGKPRKLSQADVQAVFIRSDPPFDAKYLMHTWLLDQAAEVLPVINHPRGIRTVNEKVWATRFTSLVPRTMISRNRPDLLKFIQKEKNVIAKPSNSFGGASVFLIKHGDLNTNVILETLSDFWKREVIVQQYVPSARKGDKRILLLDGEPLGAVLRVHPGNDHRNNLFAGGKAVPVGITARDREIINVLKPELKELGLHFVGIDIIGDYLIEVNVTSPTCLQEMNRFNKKSLEEKVIRFVEGMVKSKRGAS